MTPPPSPSTGLCTGAALGNRVISSQSCSAGGGNTVVPDGEWKKYQHTVSRPRPPTGNGRDEGLDQQVLEWECLVSYLMQLSKNDGWNDYEFMTPTRLRPEDVSSCKGKKLRLQLPRFSFMFKDSGGRRIVVKPLFERSSNSKTAPVSGYTFTTSQAFRQGVKEGTREGLMQMLHDMRHANITNLRPHFDKLSKWESFRTWLLKTTCVVGCGCVVILLIQLISGALVKFTCAAILGAIVANPVVFVPVAIVVGVALLCWW